MSDEDELDRTVTALLSALADAGLTPVVSAMHTEGRWLVTVDLELVEVQRLTAELALKDQALAEIKHALESGTWPGYGLTVERIERILTRLDTQGETK